MTTHQTRAASLSITKIGTSTVSSVMPTTFGYTGSLPEFLGTASPSAVVRFQTNVSIATLSASTTGVWSYIPTNLVVGANNIVITSGVEMISFVLNYATTSGVSTISATPTVLPETGMGLPAIIGILIAVGILIYSRWIKQNLTEKYE